MANCTKNMEHNNHTEIMNNEETINEEIIFQHLEKFNKENKAQLFNQRRSQNGHLSKNIIKQTNEMTIHETKQTSSMKVNLNDIRLKPKDIQLENNSNDCITNKRKDELVTDIIANVFNGKTESGGYTIGDVNIDNSEQIHVGNVTYITGPININYNVNQIKYTTDIKQEINISTIIATPTFPIVYRDMWIAEPPIEETFREDSAAKLVIICHTATSSFTKQSGNVKAVRVMQTFHIESNGWNDIAYNFLIGCDGQVYEGRGWTRVGSHSKGYNSNSLGIAFIGTFNKTLPTENALNVCQKLIEFGVQHGMIDIDYQLIAHCQCRPFLSPGEALYTVIKTWPHWIPNFTSIEKDDNQANKVCLIDDICDADYSSII